MIKRSVFAVVVVLLNMSALLGQKNYYISDAGNFQQGPYQILKYDEDGSNGKVFIKNNLGWPQDILFLSNGNQMLISNLSTNSVDVFDSETGAYIKRLISGIGGPTRMKLGKDGLLYILQWQGDGKVKKYDIQGNILSNATQTGVTTSIGMDWDDEGFLYVSSYSGKFIERFDKEGNSKGKFISTGLAGPTNIEFTDEGNLVVLDYNSGRVLLYDKDGHLIKVLFQGVQNCEGIHIGKAGEIIVGHGSAVSIYDNNNAFQKYLVPPGQNGLRNANAVVYREIMASGAHDESIKNTEMILKMAGNNSFTISPTYENVNAVFIFDIHGKKVKTFELKIDSVLDLSDLQSGMYIANIMFKDHKTRTQNLLVVK